MAVYTDVSDQDLSALLTQYEIGALIRKSPIIEGIENTNYRIETDRGVYILTLFEKRTNEADLPFFMDLMAHLAAQGLPAAAPVKTTAGNIIGALAGRPTVIIEFLPGRPAANPSAVHCRSVGALLAQLHSAVEKFPLKRTNTLMITDWAALADTCRKNADSCAPGLAALIDDEMTELSRLWPAVLPIGVVHSDLFPDNILFENDTITGVIDFYFSCTEFFAYDIAICLNAWCFDEKRKLIPQKAQSMMAAYAEKRIFTQEEIEAFPLLLRGAALRFLLTRLYDWLHQIDGAIVNVKDPLEYRDILEFHRHQYSLSSYGFKI